MRGSHALGAMAAIVLATPVAVWCLIGDISEPHGDLRMFEAPTIGRGLERTTGAAAAGMAALSAAILVCSWRDRQVSRRHVQAVAPLVIAGALIAAGGRVVTSATVGANIGGGLVLVAAPFVLLPLLVIGALRSWRLGCQPDQTWHEPDVAVELYEDDDPSDEEWDDDRHRGRAVLGLLALGTSLTVLLLLALAAVVLLTLDYVAPLVQFLRGGWEF